MTSDPAPVADGDVTAEVARSLRTPRAAAIAGMAFTVLAIAAGFCERWALPPDAFSMVGYVPDPTRAAIGRFGTMLVPFAGICFLWFIGVIRHHLGSREDRLFSTVFLGSGILLLAMVFTSTAVAASLLIMRDSGIAMDPSVRLFGGFLWDELLQNYGARMAAVFTIAATTMGRRTQSLPLWLVILGYVAGAAMMLAPLGIHYVEMLFPLWVGIYSGYIFVHFGRQARGVAEGHGT